MTRIMIAVWFFVLNSINLFASPTYPDLFPANRSTSGILSTRNLALGEARFVNSALYNVYDQGGSPMGFLETFRHRVSLDFEMLNAGLSTEDDSLKLGHRDYFLPTIRLFQPEVFAAAVYFQHESEWIKRQRGDSLETGKYRFGLDLATGASSGLFRVGFGVHALLGQIEYPGTPERILIGSPSIRLDLGSSPIPSVEVGIFVGISGQFDSLEGQAGRFERVAVGTIPKYGALLDVDSIQQIPVHGNFSLEFGTDRFFGEYRVGNLAGEVYPTILVDYIDWKTQWIYSARVSDFLLEPALRVAHRGGNINGYLGIDGNQNPFKKGAKIDSINWENGSTSFGLGGQVHYRQMVSLLFEWETSGHEFVGDTTVEKSYNRFSLGFENRLEQLPFWTFPSGMETALRLGWSWRNETKSQMGFREFQFDRAITNSIVPSRNGSVNFFPSSLALYSAFHLGLGIGLLQEKLKLDALLSFPDQLEFSRPRITREASGVEFGLTVSLSVF